VRLAVIFSELWPMWLPYTVTVDRIETENDLCFDIA